MQATARLRDLAELTNPDAPIESVSTPEPSLARYNVVGRYQSEEAARDAVLALEEIEADDAALGLVDFGSSKPSAVMRPTDSRIAGTALRRSFRGAVFGAVVSAIVIGVGVAVFGTGSILVGAAIGGALFGAFIGATWGAFVRFGGSSAYRQSFSTTVDEPTLVTLHTDDLDHARAAVELLSATEGDGPDLIERTADGRLGALRR